jgi:hypothetical protein
MTCHRVLRLDDLAFRYLTIGVGRTSSGAFDVTALFYQLELYGEIALGDHRQSMGRIVTMVYSFISTLRPLEQFENADGREGVAIRAGPAATAAAGSPRSVPENNQRATGIKGGAGLYEPSRADRKLVHRF